MTLKRFIRFCSPCPRRSFGIAQKHLSMPLICILKANLRSAGLRAPVLNYVWMCLYRDGIMNLKLLSFQYTPAETLLKAVEFSGGKKGNIGVRQQKVRPCRCVFTSKHYVNIQRGKKSPYTCTSVLIIIIFVLYSIYIDKIL